MAVSPESERGLIALRLPSVLSFLPRKASWSDVILDAELKRQLQKEYQSFFASERIYKDLGVPWKRGIIFLGPPGNGKTISLKAIMKDSGVPTLYAKTFHSGSYLSLSSRSSSA